MSRPYEVMTPISIPGCREGYRSLGIYNASSRDAAASKALREIADKPFDDEGEPLLTPDPTLIVVPLRAVVPLDGSRFPRAAVEDIAEAWTHA